MEKQFEEIALRVAELEARLASGEPAPTPDTYRDLLKEYNRLSPIADTYRAYLAAKREQEEADRISADPGQEPELRRFAAEEAAEKHRESESLLEKLRAFLIPKDREDDRNAVMEIRAGAGGEEAALFARDLFRMYRMYGDGHGYTTEVIGSNDTELGGYREIIFRVVGNGAFAKLKFESGVHRVQRIPKTETQGRIHTSTVTVAVLPEAEGSDPLVIDMGELHIESMKSSGAGGQHINKTESAVRILHIPTGIVVTSQTQRSQLQNKEAALRLLRTKLMGLENEKRERALAEERKSQIGTGDRSEKIRTYNFPQGRVTDHRIGMSLYDIFSFLNGNIDEMLTALTEADMARKLKTT